MSDAQEVSITAYRRIGELATRRRNEMGVHLIAFAAEVGIPISELTEFEHGLVPAAADDIRSIERGLGWGDGVVGRVIGEVQAGRIHPERIQMEHLDEYDSEL